MTDHLKLALEKDYEVLTPADIRQFFEDGYVYVPQALDHDFIDEVVARKFKRYNMDPSDPSTFTRESWHMDADEFFSAEAVVPKAWKAVCDLLGGDARITDEVLNIETNHFSKVDSRNWSDAFITKFPIGPEKTWQEPHAGLKNWHVDGSYFRHFLDSPEQALLVFVLWTDMEERGSATFYAPESPTKVAQLLLDHPEGIDGHLNLNVADQCSEYLQMTGKKGDIVLFNPHMLHAGSPNVKRLLRIITNQVVMLKEPLNFNRSDDADYSALEHAVLHHLGKERLDFEPVRERTLIDVRTKK